MKFRIICFAILVSVSPLGAQWLNVPTPGVPRTADGKVNLSAPMPKLPDGKPDLSGVWESSPQYFNDLARDLKPGELEMLPWAKTLQADREGRDHRDDFMNRCKIGRASCRERV